MLEVKHNCRGLLESGGGGGLYEYNIIGTWGRWYYKL